MAIRGNYRIYVVDLKPEVWSARSKMRAANPGYNPETGKGCVYVGMTKHPPKVRFLQHQSGGFTASRVVRDFGRRVQRRRSKDFKPRLSRAQAIVNEPMVAAKLRTLGYAVWPVKKGMPKRIRQQNQVAQFKQPNKDE